MQYLKESFIDTKSLSQVENILNEINDLIVNDYLCLY